MAAASTVNVKAQVDAWKAATKADAKSFVLIDADDKTGVILFTLDGKLVKASVPASAASMWMVESDEKEMLELVTVVGSWAADRGNKITVDAFLEKVMTVLSNKKAKTATAAAGANADDAWGDDDADAEHGGGGGGGDGWDEDGGGGGDDDGWGDGGAGSQGTGKSGAAAAQSGGADDEFQRWHALKKKWAKKEEELRYQLKTSGLQMIDESKLKTQIFSAAAVSKIITNTLVTLMQHGSRDGVDVGPVDDNVYEWRLRLSEFPHDTTLYKDLKKLKALYGTDYVELNLSFPMDLYPFFPVSVRLVRPRLKNFLMGRIVCSEDLQLAKWSPTREITDVLASIKRLLVQYGAVDDQPPGVNDPRNALPPYTALEFSLLRLSMLTEIGPRALKTMSDAERKDFVVPKTVTGGAGAGAPKAAAPTSAAAGAPKPGAAAVAQQPNNNTDDYDAYGGGAMGRGVTKQAKAWAAGTGYGHGSQSDWDPEAWAAAQRKKDNEIMDIVREVLKELEAPKVPAGLCEVLELSCLVPFLEQYVKNDSITDMERHAPIYNMVFAVCTAIAKHPSLYRLFSQLPFEKKALAAYIKDLGAQAAIVEKFNAQASKQSAAGAAAAAASSANPATWTTTQRIAHMAKAVAAAVKQYDTDVARQKADETALAAALAASAKEAGVALPTATAAPAAAGAGAGAAPAAASASGSGSKDSKQPGGGKAVDPKVEAARAEALKLENEYVSALSPFRFDMEIEKFGHQHYWTSHAGESSGQSPAWVRHLATEYSDLSKSLPINRDSSVFMRVHEQKMCFAQMLIVAPGDTPYAGGCFLFDMFFGPQYPGGPPLVNLQTTGGGSHRFNPNLYNTGKVCLSLLGTWSGQKGESWNPKTSTFLQVAVSIQSLIFVPQPYFNEPGYERDMGTARGDSASAEYNRDQQQATVRFAMIEMLKKPPLNFEAVVNNHFFLQQKTILATVETWAASNERVRAQLPALKAELAKLKGLIKPKD